MAVAEDFSFEERQEQERMVLESVDRFLDKDVAPYAHDLEADDTYPQEIVDKMVDMDFLEPRLAPSMAGLVCPCPHTQKLLSGSQPCGCLFRASSIHIL